MKLEWQLSDHPLVDVAFAIVHKISEAAQEEIPDVADMFPFQLNFEAQGHFDQDWFMIQITNRYRSGVPSIEPIKETELTKVRQKVLPFVLRDHQTLFGILGQEWFSSERFTYIGPYKSSAVCWPDIVQHLEGWINQLVLPKVEQLNKSRVLRAIPNPPQFNLNDINQTLWVLESEESLTQGTAFMLKGIGFVTCQHVLGSNMQAFRPENPARKFSVTVINQHPTIDIAILHIEAPFIGELAIGTADRLQQLDHIAIAGFPNYRLGDTGVIIPGLVVGFRTLSGIRRILTNIPIVSGNSGGPVLDQGNRVIGVAATGADRMEEAQSTEHHSVIPIDALRYLI